MNCDDLFAFFFVCYLRDATVRRHLYKTLNATQPILKTSEREREREREGKRGQCGSVKIQPLLLLLMQNLGRVAKKHLKCRGNCAEVHRNCVWGGGGVGVGVGSQ